MDDSDNKKKKNTLNDWSSNPFERVNHSTNFEDYACTSDETNFLYNNSHHTRDLLKTWSPIQAINRDSGLTSSKSAPKLETNVFNHLTDRRDHNSSAEVTPSGTPQSSPYSMRKVMESNRIVKQNDTKNQLSVNQKRWFNTGFFSDIKNGLEKPIPQMPKTQSFKNLCVSNFDINAVGPTSWELLIISTLDGKLTAVDVSAGHVVWSKRLSPDPLLSSTISDFEITRRGRVVRVVPSLDGNLYLYNGKTIDGIPLNADTLLKSSYKLGDDLVITGGQESHISGIDIATGRVFYECGLKGCPTTQLNENETFDNLILIKRITQTIRAIDPRSGRQKWFFSVTEPHLSETSSGCHDSTDSSGNPITDESEDILKDTDFKVIVPNGFISAKIHSKHNDQINGWSHRFDSPLVHVWHYRNGRLNPLNLFDKQKLFGFTNTDLNANGFEPSVYVGLYQNQWYIQSSDKIKGQISETKVTNDLLALKSTDKMETKSELLQIEWKPTALVFDHNKPLDSESELDFVSSPHFSFAISSENDSKMGYYLFDAIEENETKCLINSSEELLNESEYCDEDNDLMPQIIIRSL
ncbi:unnamed protein product, partial [Medioppia subpectinata]